MGRGAAGLAAGLPAEHGYDLGYRAVILQAIAEALGKSGGAEVADLTCQIAEACGAMRVMYMRAIRQHVRHRRAQPHPARHL